MKLCTLFILMIVAYDTRIIDAWSRRRNRPRDGGIYFPRRPITKPTLRRYIFDKQQYAIHWLNKPLYDDSFARDMQALWTELPNGDFDYNWISRNDDVCASGVFTYHAIQEEGNRAVYTWNGTFPTTGEAITISIFTSNPKDYVFYFLCLDNTKVVIRRGRRLVCDGPFSVVFLSYAYPPDRVRWCTASRDLCDI